MKLKVVKPKPKFYRISYAMLDNLLKKEKPVEQKKKVEIKLAKLKRDEEIRKAVAELKNIKR